MIQRKEEVLQDVVIKFAGDSGDGMQLTGSQFTNNTALLGIDLATFPDFPAEIRAPQGTLPGVSGYQLRFSSDKVYTPGDECDVLVAMNAAALKSNLVGLTIIGVINSAIAAYYYLRIIVYMYMREERVEAPVARIPAGLGIGLAISLIATIYLGVMPGRVLEYALQSAQDLIK